MGGEITTSKQKELGGLGFAGVPVIISAAGERASFRFIEFFTANIRNPNTRVSYGRAVREFCNWCASGRYSRGVYHGISVVIRRVFTREKRAQLHILRTLQASTVLKRIVPFSQLDKIGVLSGSASR